MSTNPIFNDFFNLTYTYRSSADISKPYGGFFHKSNQEKVKSTEWLEPKSDPGVKLSDYGLTDFKSRKKDVAWIVSHCKTNR